MPIGTLSLVIDIPIGELSAETELLLYSMLRMIELCTPVANRKMLVVCDEKKITNNISMEFFFVTVIPPFFLFIDEMGFAAEAANVNFFFMSILQRNLVSHSSAL